jgi:hypothetical protein
MTIQYDQPTFRAVVDEQIDKATFSVEVKAALKQLLTSSSSAGDGTVPPGTDSPDLGSGTVKVGFATISPTGVLEFSQATTGDAADDMILVNTGAATGGEPLQIQLTGALLEIAILIFDGDSPIEVTFNTIPRVIVSGRGSDIITVNGDANTTIESAGGNDTLTTSGGEDYITVRAGGNTSVTTAAGNDTIRAGSGNDTIDGGSGVDLLEYTNAGAAYTVSKNQSSGQHQVVSADGTQTIVDVERVFFSDKKVALDLMPEQNAAMSIQIINVIGAELRSDPAIVGLILDLFDSGMSLETLAQYSIDQGWVTPFAGSGSNEDLALLAYTNIYGAAPNEAQLDFALSFMDGRLASFTQAEFIATAASFELNNDAIDLVGLQQTGVEFVV